VSFGGVVLQTLDERCGAAGAAGDDEDSVVAGDRTDDLRELGAIEREGEWLRLADAGTDDDELLDAIDVAEELGGGALGGGVRGWRLGAGTLVGAVAGALDEAEIADVARDGRLRRIEAARAQTAAQQLLAVERLAIDQLEDCGLAAALHRANE